MRIEATRKNHNFFPDPSRVVARFFNTGDQRTIKLIERITSLTEKEVQLQLQATLREFTGRHRNISYIYKAHFENYLPLLNHINFDISQLSENRKLLIGSYATMEYSIESAALFNPSIVEDFDQTGLQKGEKRVIISLRATGEGHLSSIVFRRGIIDKNNDLKEMKTRNHIDIATTINKKTYHRDRFIQKLHEMQIPDKYIKEVTDDLHEQFEYQSLYDGVQRILAQNNISSEERLALEEITWLVDSYYDIRFKIDSDISERVIFPNSPSESQGIEDARFVNFKYEGKDTVYGLYTAYDGHRIIPKLIQTDDFQNFRVMPLLGNGVQNKNFALFPKKINGKYAMLARVDGFNNYIMFSDRINVWNDPILLQEPKFPWEFMQIGNCGAPIFTDKGWLILTHGVGPMRRYCIGAMLLDLEDPTKIIGRLPDPILTPLEEEREGYVPNVVYSCGGLIHNNHLILPYAVSDYSSSYATIPLNELLFELKNSL